MAELLILGTKYVPMEHQTFAAPHSCNINANLTKVKILLVYHIFLYENNRSEFGAKKEKPRTALTVYLVGDHLSCRGSSRISIRRPMTNAQQYQLKLNQHLNILKWLKVESSTTVQYNCVTSKYNQDVFRLRSTVQFAGMLGKKASIHIGFNCQIYTIVGLLYVCLCKKSVKVISITFIMWLLPRNISRIQLNPSQTELVS